MAFERKSYQEYRRQNTGSVNNGGTQTNTQPDSTVKFKRKSYHEYLNSESKTDLAGFDSYQQWLNHAHQAISDYNKLAEKAKDYDSGKKFSAYQAQNAARFGNLRNEWNQQRDAIDNLIATGGLSSEQGQAYKKQAKEIAGILSNMAKDTSAADYWKQWESEADYAATQEQQRIAGLDMESLNRKLEELDRTISKLRRNGAGYDYQANPQAYETYWRQVGELEQIRTQTKKDREALGTYQQQQKSAEAAQKEAERIAGLDMESLQRIREIYTENRNRIEQEKLQYDTISQQEQIDGLIRKQELNQQQLDEVNRDIYARERYEKGLEYQRIYETRKEDAYLPGLKDRTYQLVNGTWTNLKENLYSGMEEAERQIYNTIVAQQGLTKGEEYLEWLKPELNRRYAAQMHERLADTANAHPIAGTMMNVGAGLWKPLGYGYTAVQNIANRVNNEYQPIDPNAGWFAPNIASEATTEGLTRDMSDAGKFLTQTGLSIAQNLFFMGFGEATSLALMGLGSASDTSREILQRGGSNEQAAWGGAAAGAAEVLFEKVSLDSLIRLKDTDNLRDAVGNILKQAGVEASEEAFTELTNNLSDQLINGGLSNYQQAVQRYMAQGMEEAEAKKAASAEVAGEIGLAALGGALSGGVLAGGKTVMQYNGGQQNILQERERENRALQEDARARYEAAKKQVEAAQASAQTQDTAAAQQSKTGEAAGRTEVTYRADGARTEATGIDRIEANGKTYVKTADGNTTALEELSFAEERMGMLYENAELFGTEGGRAYVSGYDGRDIGIYTNGWAGVYNRAANGSSEAAAVKYGKEAGLSEAQALSAYYSGRNSYAAGESKHGLPETEPAENREEEAIGSRIKYSIKTESIEAIERKNYERWQAVKAATRRQSRYLDITDDRNVARYRNEVDAAMQNPKVSSIMLGMPNELLLKAGFTDAPIYLDVTNLTKIAYPYGYLGNTDGKNRHDLGFSVIKNLIYQIAKPLAITENTSEQMQKHLARGQSSRILFTEWVDQKNRRIIVPVSISEQNKISVEEVFNEVKSAYGAEEKYLEQLKDVKVIYPENEKDVRALIHNARQTRLPESISDDIFAKSILYSKDFSNTNIRQKGKKDTALRKEKFARETNGKADGLQKFSVKYLEEHDLQDYLKTGKRLNRAKTEALAQGKKILLTSETDISEYIRQAIAGERLPTAAYAMVGSRLAADVREYSNGKIDISGAYMELVANDIKHAYEEHLEAKEDGNIDLSIEDYLNIANYVDSYDSLIYAIHYKNGNMRISLQKTLENGELVIIEAGSKSRNSIQFKNMIGVSSERFNRDYAKYKKGSNLSSRGSKSSTIPLRNSTTSNNRITQGENTVNPNIRQKGKKDTVLRKEKFARETKRLVHHYSGTLTAEQQDTLRILDIAAQVLDRTVYIEDSIDGEIAGQRAERGANAYFDPRDNSYHLALDATQQGYLTIMLHEAVHDIAANNRAGYEQLAEVVMKYLQEGKAQEQVREDIRRYEQRGYREAEEIEEELVANAVGVILNDRRTAEEFAKRFLARDTKARKAFMRILDNLREYLKRTIAAIKGEADFRQTELLEKRAGAIEEIRQAMFDAMEGLQNNGQAETTSKKAKKLSPRLETNFAEKYSIDIQANRNEIAQMEAVAKLTGNEFAKSETSLPDMIAAYFSKIGNSVHHALLGDIVLDRRGIKDDIAHGIGRRKAAAFMAIPEVIRNGKIVDIRYDWKNRGYDTVILAAPIKIGTESYLMGVVVNKNVETDRLYVHEVLAINKEGQQSLFKTGGPVKNGVNPGSEAAPSVISILQNILNDNPSIRENEGNDAKEYSEKESAGKKKYSLKSTEAAVVIQPNDEQQAEQLEKLRSTLDRQYRLKAGRQMTREAAEKLAGRAIRRFHSGYAAEKLAADLQTIFDEAGRNFDADIFLAEGARAMKGVLAESSTFDKAAYAQYAPVRELLKQKMTLTETQKEEAAAIFGSYGEYRRQLFGSTSLGPGGTSLDIAWQELHRLAPELFPAESSEGDMVSALYDAVQAVKKENFYVNEFAMNLDEAATVAFADLYAEYADLTPIKMLARQMELYAKRYARESEREAGQRQRLRQEEEKRDYEALKQKRKEEQKKITRWEAQRKAELREQNSRIWALQAQKQEATGGMQRYALDAEITRLEDVKTEIDARYDRMIRNERALLEEMGKALERAAGSSMRLAADARQQMLSGKTAAKMAENRQKQAATRKRQAVRRKIWALMHTISAGTDAKHIPEALRNTVAEFLQKIDPGFREDSKAAWKWREQTAVLAARMEEYNRVGGQMQVDAYIIAQLRTIGEDIAARIQTAGSSIREMKLTELQKLDETLDLLGAAIRNSDRILAEERSTRLAAVAQQSMVELRQRKAYQGRMKGMNELLNLQQLDAFSFAEKLGPAFQNSIFKNLRSGLDHKIQMLQEASAAMEQAAEQLPGKRMRDKLKALSGEQANTTIFPLENGTQIRLTTGQIMELYLLNQREAGRRHIYRGGITVEEYTAGRRKVKKQSRKQVSEADIDAITETLTPAQKRFAEILQHFCATTGSEWGNRVSLSLWGIKKFTEQRYWPIRVDNNTLETNTMPVDASSIARLKNIGMSQSTNPGADNALILGDVIDTYIRHMDDMTSYAAYVLPLEDAQRWLNYHGEDGTTMKESVEKALGRGGVDYLEDFLETLNGGKRKGDSAPNWYNRLMRNYKIAAVAANLRVVIQQPSAYARAAAEIAPKYLLHAGKSRAQQESGMRMAQRYAPIFAWKQWGFRDTFVAGDLRSIMVGDRSFYEQIIQQSGALAGLADDMTWGALWNACAAEIRDTTTLEEGTEAFNRRVGERFGEVIDKTQVVDSPFHRSMGMRSGNNIWKTMTAFMSEPIKSYNMLYRAVADLRQSGWKDKAAWQRAVRSGTVFAAQNIINSLLAAVIDVFRDDDRDETLAEKYFGHTLENFLEGINPLETIPLAGDLLESLAPMLEGENPDFSNFQSDLGYEGLANLLTAAYDLYNSLGDYKKNDYYAIYKLISALGQVMGIPIGNAWRMVNSILQTAGVEITPYTKLATPYTAAEHAIKEIEAGRSGQATVDAYAEARGAEMLETQPEKYTDIQSAQNFAGNEVYRAMAILLSRENEAIPLTYAARERADTAEVDRIRAELTAKGYPAEVVDEAILIYASDMQEQKSYGEKEYQAQFYHTRHLEKAIDGGNLQDIRNIRAELIRDSTAQDPTATVDQAGLSYVKQQYLQAYESGASTQGLKRIATEIFGATEEQLQNWLLDDRSGDFYTALEAYDTTAANRSIAQLKELGREEKSITTSVTRKYREKLLQAYQSGEMGTVNRLMDLLHGLALYDFRTGEPYYSYERMWGWLEAEA
jgi:hypothetical protein|nr:MAG TPA: Large polyvalent protein-associated domain 3 [Caudoviricetes sp.]